MLSEDFYRKHRIRMLDFYNQMPRFGWKITGLTEEPMDETTNKISEDLAKQIQFFLKTQCHPDSNAWDVQPGTDALDLLNDVLLEGGYPIV